MTSHRFDWSTPYPSARLPVFARNIVSTSHPLAAQAGLQGDAAGRQRRRRGDRHRGGDDAGGALQQRPRLRHVLHPLGRREAARPQCFGPGAGGLDAGVLSPQVRRRRRPAAEARLGSRSPCRAPWPAGSRCPSASASCRSPTCWRRRSRPASAATPCRSSCRRSGSRRRPARRRARLGRGLPAEGPAARGRRALRLPGRRAQPAGDRRDPRRRALRRRDRRGGGQACGGERRGDDGARLRVVRARMGRDDRHRRLGPSPARDPAQRPGHRRADRPRHRPPSRPASRCRSTAPSASTCRSRR